MFRLTIPIAVSFRYLTPNAVSFRHPHPNDVSCRLPITNALSFPYSIPNVESYRFANPNAAPFCRLIPNDVLVRSPIPNAVLFFLNKKKLICSRKPSILATKSARNCHITAEECVEWGNKRDEKLRLLAIIRPINAIALTAFDLFC